MARLTTSTRSAGWCLLSATRLSGPRHGSFSASSAWTRSISRNCRYDPGSKRLNPPPGQLTTDEVPRANEGEPPTGRRILGLDLRINTLVAAAVCEVGL